MSGPRYSGSVKGLYWKGRHEAHVTL